MNIKREIEKMLDNGEVMESKNPDFGDYSTNIALKSKNSRKTAEDIVKNINLNKEMIDRVEIAGQGFINFFLKKDFLKDFVQKIVDEGEKFGSSDIGKGEKVLVEFVSANPTGPLNVANGRAGAVGDSLVKILNFIGFNADSEYYVDDSGTQVENLEKSLSLRLKELNGEETTFPENGYKGDYIKEIAKEIKQKNIKDIKTYGINRIIEGQKSSLENFGIKFNKWTYESDIRKSGKPEKVIEFLKSRDLVYEKEGALWFKSTTFGDEKDRVLIKSNGEYTYLVPDIAYHIDKFKRGYKTLINLWGPDHHGYIARLKGGISGCNYPAENLKIIIIQWVTLIQQKEKTGMSKREGKFVDLDSLISDIGKDVAKFFFLSRKKDSHLDFDLDLAKTSSLENPVYYIQYAYARISSIFRFAKEKDIDVCDVNVKLLNTEEEINLMRKLVHFPEVVETAGTHLEPHYISFYLQELAGLFHNFYEKERVVTEDIELTKARLQLVSAVKTVLSNGLTLLGISAPEKM